MAVSIKLTEDEQLLYDEISKYVNRLRKHYSNDTLNKSDIEIIYQDMAQKAHELHMRLKTRDLHLEPRHHKYMLKNRGVPVTDVEFYNHLHPVEDLIAFINDPDANNDPKDTTIGATFDFRIYTRRWGHYDPYELKRTKKGWEITGPSAFNHNTATKKGNPAVFDTLRHDFVNYPYQISEALEAIWNKAANGASKEDVQQAISAIAEWISTCEKTTPSIGILEGQL